MNNFSDVPKEKGTRIIEQQEIIINGISVLLQHWSWDGMGFLVIALSSKVAMLLT